MCISAHILQVYVYGPKVKHWEAAEVWSKKQNQTQQRTMGTPELVRNYNQTAAHRDRKGLQTDIEREVGVCSEPVPSSGSKSLIVLKALLPTR